MMRFQLFRLREKAFEYIQKFRPLAEYLFPNLDRGLEIDESDGQMMAIATILPKDYDGLQEMSARTIGE